MGYGFMSQSHSNNPTLVEKLRDSWVEYLHTVYVVCVIGGWYVANIYDPTEFKSRVALIAILVYFVILLLFLGYFIHAYSRKARYAEATICLHQAVHEIRDAGTYLNYCVDGGQKYELAEFKLYMTRMLESVVRAYAIVTGTNCRAAIKLLGNSGKVSYVKTMARDSTSAQYCRDKDKNESNRHAVTKNTDYNLILNGGRAHYFSGDIVGAKDYLNTSREEYGDKLPYSSVIVLPVRSATIPQPDSDADKYRVLGFLAVDSAARNVFVEKYDVQMGAVVADALYPIMDLWAHVHDRFHAK